MRGHSSSNPAADNINEFSQHSRAEGTWPLAPVGRDAQPWRWVHPRRHPRTLASQPRWGGNRAQLCLLAATVTRHLPQKVSDEQQEGPAPSPQSRGRTSHASQLGGAKRREAPRSLLLHNRREVPSHVPVAGFTVYISPCRPASVFMCVFPCVCVWLRVCGGFLGVLGCLFASGSRLTSSEMKTSLEAWQLFPKPGSSAASRQTVTAGLMTEHTRFLRRAVTYSETKEIKDYADSNKHVAGAPRGTQLPRGARNGQSCRSPGLGSGLGRGSAERRVGIGSATGPGRGLGGFQQGRGLARATLDFSWKLA